MKSAIEALTNGATTIATDEAVYSATCTSGEKVALV